MFRGEPGRLISLIRKLNNVLNLVKNARLLSYKSLRIRAVPSPRLRFGFLYTKMGNGSYPEAGVPPMKLNDDIKLFGPIQQGGQNNAQSLTINAEFNAKIQDLLNLI